MTDDFEATVAAVIAAQLKALEDRLGRKLDATIAARPLPPFVAPQAWQKGRHSASAVVRHRNGIFCALRDTEGEPGADADGGWLPLLVGIAEVKARFVDEREFRLDIASSDGAVVTLANSLPIPIYEGIWDKDGGYSKDDMTTHRGSLWIAVKASAGVQPGSDEAADSWRLAAKSGERGALPSLTLDDKGLLQMKAGDQPIGAVSIRSLLEEVLGKLLDERFPT